MTTDKATIDELVQLTGEKPRTIRKVIQMLERPTPRQRAERERLRLMVGALEDLKRRAAVCSQP